MKILITGATGLVGTALCEELLTRGHRINYLTTREPDNLSLAGCTPFRWNPEEQLLDQQAIDNVEVIVHLAGASVSKRWTNSYKKTIIQSRVAGANMLSRTLQSTSHNVRKFISASGISIYPNSFDECFDETHQEVGNSFLADVAVNWEAVAREFESIGLEVSCVRTGIVLAKDKGALPKIVKPIRMGVGAAIGSGKQWQSWIHLQDLVKIYTEEIEESGNGVLNAVAPNPVTQGDLTKAIARKLKKPVWLPNIPGWFLKLILGEMGSLALDSQCVKPKRLLERGFKFDYPKLEEALDDLLK